MDNYKYLIDTNQRKYDDNRKIINEYSIQKVKVLKETSNFITVEYSGNPMRYNKKDLSFTRTNLFGIKNKLFDSYEEAKYSFTYLTDRDHTEVLKNLLTLMDHSTLFKDISKFDNAENMKAALYRLGVKNEN